VRIELIFEKSTSSKSELSRWGKAHFVPKRPMQLRRRNTYICQKKTIFVRGRSLYTLFPCENLVSSWKEFVLICGLSKVEISSLCSK
jgi:hypothetical protein